LRIVAQAENRITLEPWKGADNKGQRMQRPDYELVGADIAGRFFGLAVDDAQVLEALDQAVKAAAAAGKPA
jgi:hypothetical protein